MLNLDVQISTDNSILLVCYDCHTIAVHGCVVFNSWVFVWGKTPSEHYAGAGACVDVCFIKSQSLVFENYVQCY